MPKVVTVRSIYGLRTHQPLVEITIPDGTADKENGFQVIRTSPKDAKALALNILQASESSLVDKFLIDFFRTNNILDEQQTHVLITEFRKYRASQEV
jgi:hypothetical protein